jgi:glycogen debranching enzyme
MANLKSLHIPRLPIDFSSTAEAEPTTPKTPADEGIEFFEFGSVDNKAPIRVYELSLDPDGGPNKDRSV